jgi:hypothetical protein
MVCCHVWGGAAVVVVGEKPMERGSMVVAVRAASVRAAERGEK